jgi:hypothetical protein
MESVHEKIRLNLLARRKGSVWVPGEHMDLMTPAAKLMAEVVSDPASSADGVREENICQHQDFHRRTDS